MTRRANLLLVTLAWFGGLLAPSRASAEEAVPPELALKVMLKVLTYDASFQRQGDGDFVIAIAWPEGAEGARDAAMKAAGMLAEKSIQGRALRFVPVSYGSEGAISELARRLGAAAVLAPGGLKDGDYAAIARAARSLKVYGLALVPAGAEAGLVLGVANNNGRPQVLLHRESSQAIGASWPPAVLKLARLL